MTAIKFENVYKSYPFYSDITAGFKHFLLNLPKTTKNLRNNSYSALEDISFEIKHGESVAFIGRNGAGKSTTLGLIAGVLKPNRGQVVVNGRVSPLLELGGGFHPELSGIDNIKLNGVLLGLSSQQVNSKLEEIVDFSELGEFIHQPIRTYSSGMLARLGFSVVSSLDPELLLIDEVLAVGDTGFQKKCFTRIEKFRNDGVTIIIVTHDISGVKQFCNRAIWIENHKICMDGPSKIVAEAYDNQFQN